MHRDQRPRNGRRDLSPVRLGRTAGLATCDAVQRPPLPFRYTPGGWTFRWRR